MSRKDRQKGLFSDYEDDGRTIANMDVAGMPWTDGFGQDMAFGKRYGRGRNSMSSGEVATQLPPMSLKETWTIIANAVLAGLALAGVFIGGLIAFVLFCIHVWFR